MKNKMEEKGFKPLKEIKKEEKSNLIGKDVVLWNSNTDEIKNIAITAIDDGPEGDWKIFYDNRGLISSSVTSFYYKL